MKVFVLVLKIAAIAALIFLATKLFLSLGGGVALKVFWSERLADIKKAKVIFVDHKDAAGVTAIVWILFWWAFLRVAHGFAYSSGSRAEAKS